MTIAIADTRPPGLDVPFRPGNALTLELTWPTGELSGRTFTSSLNGVTLALSVLGDVMTIEATEAQTLAVTAPATWLLTETTAGATNDLIIGTWSPSTRPGTADSLALTVTTGTVAIDLAVTSDAAKVNRSGDTMTGGLTLSGGADLAVTGDATITGEIKTGTFGTPATFGGIEREGRVFPAGEMCSPTGVMNFGDGFPRVNLPDGVTTNVYIGFEVEEWWLDSTIGVYFEWCNDHTTTGNVRFDCDIKECDIATQTLAAAGTIASRTFTEAAPAANTPTTSIVGGTIIGTSISFNPGTFASFYVLRISRLGADAADTLAGPVGLLFASMTRGQ